MSMVFRKQLAAYLKPPPIATDPMTSDDCPAVEAPLDNDSGYGSATITPIRTSSGSQSRDDECPGSTPRNGARLIHLPFAVSEDLKSFEKELDEATWNRFKDVSDRLQAPLLSYMQKSSKKYKPMALRLVILGKTQEDARPSIVVLCDSKVRKRAKSFFEQDWVKELRHPSDRAIPSLEAVVVGRSPQLRMAVGTVHVYSSVICTDQKVSTLCGTPIKLTMGDTERITTLGGCVKVIKADGSYEIYGMTAGHMVDQLLEANSTVRESSSSEDESDISSSEDGEDDIDPGSLRLPAWSLPKPALDESFRYSSEKASATWIGLGSALSLTSTKPYPIEKYLDWSLVRIEDPTIIKENLLRDFEHAKKYKSGNLTLPLFLGNASYKRDVVMMSGLQGLKEGLLSTSSARVALGLGREFIDIHLLTLANKKGGYLDVEILEGDSGSWVVDVKTGEVLGHVVASDAFGDGYVIPITSTFRDIANRLDAVSVNLPTSVDIISYIFDKVHKISSIPIEHPECSEKELLEGLQYPPEDSGYSSLPISPVTSTTLFKAER
ncbi:hypothetical protein EV356DRAFT_518209 [Viridothelium virens]|uniref:Uncharacterized protein n=1 Tax=Viridothelium virens TaxID=1048519 RepID=A0A6A6H176_VIRVR|nr:hypothetical protein EV356DRAFT_518209 [Viridothelium virens]